MAGPPDFAGIPEGLPVTALQIRNSRIYIGVTAPTFAIAIVLVVARLASRWKSAAGIAADDYLIIAAVVLSCVEIALIIATVSANLAIPSPALIPFATIGRNAPMTIIAEIFTTWCVALIKTSIAVMLVRLQRNSKGWTRFLYALIGLQVLTAVFVTVLHCTRCIPTEAVWNPHIVNKWCWSDDAFKITMTTASTIVIVTDVIFSLIPLTFLHLIRRTAVHRVIIGGLMSLGLFASSASAIKTIKVHRFNADGDAAGNGIAIALGASLEGTVGIIAACLPCLRGPFLGLLSRLGIYSEFTTRVHEEDKSSTWPTSAPTREGAVKFEGGADPFQDALGGPDASGSDGSQTATELVVIQDKEDAPRPTPGNTTGL
ncbi:hypothetical protein QBC34DRAFT_66520 [Podospora aff. communis PSN243]|uniref:Rhodopsin domain-containing protein n=1 Tax=Podospora aff. communis PSN243 TaxID=3040156 RepID=A0AAV9H343_9PEZI|nr:hypothetical protein QBC34DRAFT_66520 [Podospora aff. communis PSN243]